ncbi:MAG: sugar nucleotide-binding protein [Chloroflexi bacterium]|nr:sugar nucleotide-binding protein [Chloroflexota bacterium]
MGSPQFAVPTLEALARDHTILAVFTQPDKPAGRGQQITAVPVKQWAVAQGVPVHQPKSFRKEPQAIDVLRDLKPEVIVNATAYTAVDRAESEAELAMTINGLAPGKLAQTAAELRAVFIHYSTDYVFDGKKGSANLESDTPNPLNVYGQSKLAGEKAIQASAADYLILRTTWVYAARGHNFVKSILRLAAEREQLNIVADQIGAPTWARLIAESTAHILRQKTAQLLFLVVEHVPPIASKRLVRAIARQCNGYLYAQPRCRGHPPWLPGAHRGFCP